MSRVMELYHGLDGAMCACGRIHRTSVKEVVIEEGAIRRIPDILSRYGVEKPFLLADANTWKAAGEQVRTVLMHSGIPCSHYVFEREQLEPDEITVGSAAMHLDYGCDAVIAIGSGVINDTGKILASMTKTPYIVVGTAPSMDGYASKTSSMSRDGLKVSIGTRCADVIIGDLDVLCAAPEKLLISGLGDMLAKYVSICEWRMAHLLVGEAYCEAIASLVRASLDVCVKNACGLLNREKDAVRAVFEGLVVCGAAMEFAGLSRPASGVEHYFSHVWDMRGLEFGTPVSTHGIQCALGTLLALRLYEKIRKMTPDKARALARAKAFDFDAWSGELRGFLGKGAEAMIRAEAREGKYDLKKHEARLERIVANWDALLAIMDEELPAAKDVEQLLERIGAPKEAQEIGIARDLLPMSFKATKDIRDKYVLSRLCWDLGVLDETAESLR